jgi:hypothetical protein
MVTYPLLSSADDISSAEESSSEEGTVDKATGLIKETKPLDRKEIKFSGFLGDDYSKMKKGNGDSAAYSWVKEGVDFSRYNKFIIEKPVILLTAEKDGKVAVDPDDLKNLSDSFRKKLVEELQDGYSVVEQPGEGVLRIRPAITSVKGTSVANVASKLLVSVNVDTGHAVMEAAAEDSVSGERLAAAVDGREGSRIGMVSGYTKWGHTKAAFSAWAKRFKERVDEWHGVKKTAEE